MDIDEMAFKGYDYALGLEAALPDFEDDMGLMAFNAGISNANIRHGLKVPHVKYLETTHVEHRGRVSFKELQTVWGQN